VHEKLVRQVEFLVIFCLVWNRNMQPRCRLTSTHKLCW